MIKLDEQTLTQILDSNNQVLFDLENAFNPEHYLYFYETILTPERLKNELDFLIQYTNLTHPMKILDMACGFGRHAIELAKHGHTVTGIDSSIKFLDMARQNAKTEGVQIDYIHADMRYIADSIKNFDRVFVLFNALGYCDDSENEQIFQNLYNVLKPGGILCFDTHDRDLFLSYSKPFSLLEKEGNLMIDRNSFDTLTGRNLTRRTIIKDGKITNFEYSIRFYNPSEISQLLKKVGFSSCSFYGNWDGSQLDNDSKRMIVIAKKDAYA